MKYWGQNKSLFSIRIVAYCLMIVNLSLPLIGHAQIFNKKHELSPNALNSYNIEVLSNDSLLLFPVNYLPGRLWLNSLLIDGKGDSIRSSTYIDSNHTLYSGWANSATPTNDGGFIMGGGITDTSSYGHLMKYNRYGDIVWTRTFGDTVNWFTFRQAIQTTDGGFAVVGEYEAVGSRPDGWLVKTDSLGNLQWQKFYSTTIGTFERLSSVFQTTDGGYVLGGTELEFPNQNIRNYDPIVIKVDSLGNQQWRYKYDTPANDGVCNVIQTQDNNFVAVSGESMPESAPFNQVPIAAKALMFKLDQQGHFVWKKTYGFNSANHSLQVVKELSNGHLVACGRRRSATNAFIGGLLLKTDANGDSIWVNSYAFDPTQSASSNYLWDVVQMPDGGFTATGETIGTIASVNYRDVWLIRVDSNGCILQSCLVDLDDLAQESHELKLYPNPSSGIVNIQTSKSIESIQIYNVQGQLLHTSTSLSVTTEGSNHQFELPEEKGMYLVRLEDEEGRVFTKKIVRQ